MLTERANRLRDIRDIQGENGNWNYDVYMYGMYHGLALAVSIMDNEPPAYREVPEKWLADMDISDVEPVGENPHDSD